MSAQSESSSLTRDRQYAGDDDNGVLEYTGASKNPIVYYPDTGARDDYYELRGRLRELRDTKWRKDLKDRKFVVLDGKHANKIARFRYWSGTVAYVKFKDDAANIGLPIDREILLLRQNIV